MKQPFASVARLRGGGNPFLFPASQPASASGSATLPVPVRSVVAFALVYEEECERRNDKRNRRPEGDQAISPVPRHRLT
jgi:hypothetical protein